MPVESAAGLTIAPGLTLPREAVTQTFAILAKRGVGKTYTAAVMAEELLGADLHVVIADPVGVWWGLRAAADGRGPGIPILVMGGDHGDVPLDPGSGELVADLLVDDKLSAVLDLSHMRKGEQTRFMERLAERLYHRNRAPLHLVLDEADAFASQRPMPGEQRLLGAIEDLVRRGRARGLGVTLITQRAAVLNKNVLTQVEVLVVLRTIAPQDRDAVDAWVRVHGTEAQRTELLGSLASLEIGTAWWWSPGWLDLFKRVHVRQRRTFDSSATPRVGTTAALPKRLAEVDLEALRGRMAQVAARLKADDPRELRKRVAQLERELTTARAQPAVRERIEVPVLGPAHVAQLEAVRAALDTTASSLRGLQALLAPLADQRSTTTKFPSPSAQDAGPVAPATPPSPRAPRARGATSSSEGGVAGGERKILAALAQYPAGRSKVQVAILTGYAHNGGGFNNYLGALRTRGCIEGDAARLVITDVGLRTLGPCAPLPSGRDLVEHWLAQLGRAERLVLLALVQAYPRELSKAELAEATGYQPGGGGFNNALSRLRTLELVEGRGRLCASAALVEEAAA